MAETKTQLPFYGAIRRGRETCADPGACGEQATNDVVMGGVELGFCQAHYERAELVASRLLEAAETA